MNGWEVLKALPLTRRVRKRLHQSHRWVSSLCSGSGDPQLRARCQEEGYELLEVDVAVSKGWDLTAPSVWRALSWAAYTGRVVAVLADPPFRTWQQVQTQAEAPVVLRTFDQPWGLENLPASLSAKVDEDTLLAVQPLWLWTVASIARGVGIPLCYSEGEPGGFEVKAWSSKVMKPFATWSNCSAYRVPRARKGPHPTRPLRGCSNLGFTQYRITLVV